MAGFVLVFSFESVVFESVVVFGPNGRRASFHPNILIFMVNFDDWGFSESKSDNIVSRPLLGSR